MVVNKKGIFFTLIAIALLSLAALSFTLVSLSHERDSVRNRVDLLNNYVLSIENDISRKLYISSFRIFFIFEQRIVQTGSYLGNTSTLFKEAFFNGTIANTSSEEETVLLTGVKYQEIMSDLVSSAQKVNLNVTFTNPILSIQQVDPWNVLVSLNVSMYVQDYGELASWNRTKQYQTYVPIDKFDDPFYLMNTNNLVVKKMVKSPYTVFANGTNVSNLNDHINKSYYFATNESPSFMNRLEGNFSANIYGVESFVNTQQLAALGITVKDKSVVDHVYFSNSTPSTKTITGAPSWFKIDTTHVPLYNLSSVAV